MRFYKKNPNRLNAYLEHRAKRDFVGFLLRTPNSYVFQYNSDYLNGEGAIALGPNIPLTSEPITSSRIFSELEDRIPSRRNPAYPEYCKEVGISPEEADEIILLSTLGRRGASKFIFEPGYDLQAGEVKNELLILMQNSKLSQRDMAAILEIPLFSFQRIIGGKTKDGSLTRLIALYLSNIENFSNLIETNGQQITDERRMALMKAFLERCSNEEIKK